MFTRVGTTANLDEDPHLFVVHFAVAIGPYQRDI